MNGQNKRIFNYRPMCLLAMALVSGILLGECMFLKNALFRFIPLALLLAAFVVFVCLKKTRRYAFAVVGVIVGFLGICGTNDIFAKNTAIGEYEGEIYGRISSEIRVEDDGTFRFFIEDVYAGGEALEYEAYVVLYAEEIDDCNAGDIIKITGKLVANKHTQFDSFHAYDVAKREGYVVYSGNAEKVAEGELHFWERIPYKIKYNFYKSGMGDKNAAICTALVLGDKEGLDEELYDDISTSGLAHVLAVSGLHITILSTALFFVLRKCKINAKVSLILVFLFTLFYCFI